MLDPFFHASSGCVRFWVPIAGIAVGASVSQEALHERYAPQAVGDDPLATFLAHATGLEGVVRRRVAQGCVETVVIRPADLAVA